MVVVVVKIIMIIIIIIIIIIMYLKLGSGLELLTQRRIQIDIDKRVATIKIIGPKSRLRSDSDSCIVHR